MKFKLSFVFFDKQGEPHPAGELDEYVKRELMPVLFDDGEWKGPVWKRNERGDLEAIDSEELLRMHWYSFKSKPGEVTTERLSASENSGWLYHDPNGRRKIVPSLESGEGLRDIPMR